VTWFRPAPSGHPPTSLAVLPFDDLSPEGDQAWLAGGIAEELIESLSRIRELRVIARTSSTIAKASGADLAGIGAQLQVGTVVEGSVRRSGDQLAVTAQLIRVADASHLWSGRYERTLDDVFAIQREIANGVAEAIRAELGGGDTWSFLEGDARYLPNDVRAWELVQRGWELGELGAIEQQAADLFHEAIAIDPDYLYAHGGLMWHHYYRWLWRDPREERLQLALESADRMREIDPTWYELHQLEGNLSLVRWDFEAAEVSYLAALEAMPGEDGGVHSEYAYVLADMGRIDEACTHFRKAVELDPTRSGRHIDLGARCERARGNYDAAIQRFEHALTLGPDWSEAAADELGLTYHQKGMDAEALEAYLRRPDVDAELESALRRGFEEGGWAGLNRALISERAARSGDSCTPLPPLGARHYAFAGQRDEMYRCLDRAVAERGNFLLWLWEKFWDPYRDEPRFQAILHRLRLADRYSTTSLDRS
jgi:TolB-like protein/Flp pilus assembly protein TadD